MKHKLFIPTAFTAVFIFFSFTLINCRNRENEKEDITEFLTEMADARLMDAEEGKLAMERGTTQDIKDYGRLMVKDQALLLERLRVVAQEKNVALPTTLSEKKANGLADLKEEHGEDFDKKFIKMITIDHKRDVKAFKKAAGFDDPTVKKFAADNLPTIQSHLDKIKAIKKSR